MCNSDYQHMWGTEGGLWQADVKNGACGSASWWSNEMGHRAIARRHGSPSSGVQCKQLVGCPMQVALLEWLWQQYGLKLWAHVRSIGLVEGVRQQPHCTILGILVLEHGRHPVASRMRGPIVLIYLNRVSSTWPAQFKQTNIGDSLGDTTHLHYQNLGWVSYHNSLHKSRSHLIIGVHK
jgi:hypothetical protein